MQPQPAPVDTTTFEDVEESDWFYNDVEWVYERGLFGGTSATTFSPNS